MRFASERQQNAMPRTKLNYSTLAAARARAASHHKICVFNVHDGAIEITNTRDSDKARIVKALYAEMQHNAAMKAQFMQVVELMPLKRRRDLALESLNRFHEAALRANLARKVLPEVVSRHRASLLKHLEVDRVFGDLSKDTSTLASVRIASAAVDALLYQEAVKVAEQQMKQRRALVLPETTRPTDVLEMRLDAWRRQNVPFGPRNVFA